MMFKRMFSKKRVVTVTKSIRVTELMWRAIERLASEVGESPNSYIVLILDQHLQNEIDSGRLKLPKELKEQLK